MLEHQTKLIAAVHSTVSGELVVSGVACVGIMPPWASSLNETALWPLTHGRQNFGNSETGANADQVARIRNREDFPRRLMSQQATQIQPFSYFTATQEIRPLWLYSSGLDVVLSRYCRNTVVVKSRMMILIIYKMMRIALWKC